MKLSVIIWLVANCISPAVFACSVNQLQHAVNFRPVSNIEPYYVSEKLDGVRGFWDGKQLYTRQGNIITVPSWFTERWPNTPLDGELWLGRARFDEIAALVRSAHINAPQWRQVRYHLFDLPCHLGTFAERVAHMTLIVNTTNSRVLTMIPQQKLATEADLLIKLKQVEAERGEGLMLHHQSASYQSGRNTLLMKLKSYQDEEAVVVDHLAGKGKFSGMLGALTVKNADGILFKIGSGFSRKQRQQPPAVGTLIVYKYFGKTANGVPRFASFLRLKTDAAF